MIKSLSKSTNYHNIVGRKKWKKVLMHKDLIDIKTYSFFCFPLLCIKYDGIHDIYYLFNKFVVFKHENDRDFWNDWE